MKVAASQLPDIRENIEEALQEIETQAAKAQTLDVDLLCFPECFLQGYLTEEKSAKHYALDLASSGFSGVLERLGKVAPMLVFGMIEASQGKIYNTAVVVKSGKLIGSYRKVHLLDGESVFTSGSAYPVFNMSGFKFGINICYDTNFPQAADALSSQGAKLIVCPSNNMMSRRKSERLKHLHNEVRGKRCRETGLWLISSDITGERGDRISYGPTAILNPKGEVTAQVPLLETGMVIGEISLNISELNS